MTKKWRFLVRVDEDGTVHPYRGVYTPLDSGEWAYECAAGITESSQGGWWIPVEVEVDDE